MNDNRKHLDSLVEAHLDREFADRSAAGAKANEPGEHVSREVAVQAVVDAALKRQFDPPASPKPLPRVQANGGGRFTITESPVNLQQRRTDAPAQPKRGSFAQRLPWYAAAAVILLSIGAWQGWFKFSPAMAPGLDETYQFAAGSASLQWLSRDGQSLPEVSSQRLGVALKLEDLPAAVNVLGVIELPGMPESLGLLAEVQGEKVLLIVRPMGARTLRDPSHGCSLFLFERQMANLTLHEVSPVEDWSLLHAVQLASALRSP